MLNLMICGANLMMFVGLWLAILLQQYCKQLALLTSLHFTRAALHPWGHDRKQINQSFVT